MAERDVALSGLITKHETQLLTAWMRNQLDAGSLRSGQIKEDELRDHSTRFLRDFTLALKSGEVDDINGEAWSQTRDLLGSFSRSRGLQADAFALALKRTGQIIGSRTAAKPA